MEVNCTDVVCCSVNVCQDTKQGFDLYVAAGHSGLATKSCLCEAYSWHGVDFSSVSKHLR
jgi:hypothetical protein